MAVRETLPHFAWAAWRRGEDVTHVAACRDLLLPADTLPSLTGALPGFVLLRPTGENSVPAVLSHPGAEHAELFKPSLLTNLKLFLLSTYY